MFQLKTTTQPIRRALLVGIQWQGDSAEEAQSLLEELGELTDTLGLEALEKRLVRAKEPQPGYLLGRGKASEIVELAKQKKADVIVFDDTLAPAQQRNWEALGNAAVIDREEVILDIFARRARSREARLQVDLARMEYSLPRLTRAWRHLERQAGTGFGMTGAGETQLETDRRLVRRRIDRLKNELEGLLHQRATRRKQRQRRAIPHFAIVGYTNAGKSSLFKLLTGEDVFIEDRLFATLDTTTRKVQLPSGHGVVFTDTVGFIRKLPHGLVESFKATLEEAVTADGLVHVLDASHPEVLQFEKTTLDVLQELGAETKKVAMVFNKMDLNPDPARMASLRRRYPRAVFMSAKTGEGLAALHEHLDEMIIRRLTPAWDGKEEKGSFLLPPSRYDLVLEMKKFGRVFKETYENGHIRLIARLPARLLHDFAEFRQGMDKAE